MRVNQILWINNEIYFHFKFNVTIKQRQQWQKNPAAISLKSNNKNKKYLDSEWKKSTSGSTQQDLQKMNRWEFRIILCTNKAVSDYRTYLCFHREAQIKC